MRVLDVLLSGAMRQSPAPICIEQSLVASTSSVWKVLVWVLFLKSSASCSARASSAAFTSSRRQQCRQHATEAFLAPATHQVQLEHEEFLRSSALGITNEKARMKSAADLSLNKHAGKARLHFQMTFSYDSAESATHSPSSAVLTLVLS